MFLFYSMAEAPPDNMDDLTNDDNFDEGDVVFDTGVMEPTTGAVRGVRDYGKTRSEERRAYCRIWLYARSHQYPMMGPVPGQPDRCS